MSAQRPTGHPLLVVIDPTARAMDGESVRIAKDVLCAGASSVKIALPGSAEEAARVLAHRGRRWPVVVGDDRALLRTVRTLHRERTLAQVPVGVVPVGRSPLARALGVPAGVLPAARAVLDGVERELDMLVDDSGGIVLGTLRIPCGGACGGALPQGHWWAPVGKTARSFMRTLPGLGGLTGHVQRQRLRVEADGALLADVHQPVREVSVRTSAPGFAEVLVRAPDEEPVRVRARTVTVSGRDFRYHADTAEAGPVRRRTWTVRAGAWRLTVPRPPAG